MYGCNLSTIDGTENETNFDETIKLPSKFSYKKYLPKVLNQEDNPICIPCALSSYINWKLNLKTGSQKDNKVKLWDIYNSKGGNDEGMNFKEAFDFLIKDGVKYKKNKLFKIENYAKIKNIVQLRMSIITNGPCLCVLPIYTNNGENDFWNDKYGNLLGYHAVSIVGYTSNGFIIRNSWGRNYGINGYYFLNNKDFGKIKELWTIL